MAAIVIPEKVVVWKLGGKPGNLKSQNQYATNTGYNMLCRTNKKYLTYKEVKLGINLDYVSDAAVKKAHFRLPDKKEREILTGEKVALGIGGGDAFLKYAHRTVGINLDWSENPVYEWKIFGATGEEGKPIATGEWVCMINLNVQPKADFFIYFDRPAGGDVGWTTSKGFWDSVKDKVVSALTAKAADHLAQETSKDAK